MSGTTLNEVLRVVIFLGGLGFSAWALIDDAVDLLNVRRFGEVGGPRWYAAAGHFLFNLTLLIGWLLFGGVAAIAVYLPPRPGQTAEALTIVAGWLNFGFSVCVLVGQVHQRAARFHLKRLPIEAWERMVATMFDGLDLEGRAELTGRLLRATHAGREMGHLVRNELQLPVSVLDAMAADAALTMVQRDRATQALANLERVAVQVEALHAEIKAQEAQS